MEQYSEKIYDSTPSEKWNIIIGDWRDEESSLLKIPFGVEITELRLKDDSFKVGGS